MATRNLHLARAGGLAVAAVVAIAFGANADSTFASGPFNARVRHPVILADGASEIERVLGGETHRLGRLQFSSGDSDNNVPVYTAHEDDPHYRIHCMKYTNCPIEGAVVAIPRGAKAEGNLGNRSFEDDGQDDRHLAVRNVDTGVETDLWLSPEPGGEGGTLDVGYGGSFPFSSGGVGHPGATAAGFALSLGRIDPSDLIKGRIAHALFLITPCENGHVAPAIADDGGHDAGCPPIGARLWLDSTESAIRTSGASREARVILRAMHEYGGFIGDRCTQCTLRLALRGGLSETAAGRANSWGKIARHFPSESPSGPHGEYHIDVATGSIDLARHLHAIAWP